MTTRRDVRLGQKGILNVFSACLFAQLFDTIRKNNESLLSKLKVVCGDVGLDELGVAPEMKEKILSEVSIVFHGAATLNLDATLAEAVNLNTSGTLRMLEFCSGMKNLEVLIVLSRVGSNTRRILPRVPHRGTTTAATPTTSRKKLLRVG